LNQNDRLIEDIHSALDMVRNAVPQASVQEEHEEFHGHRLGNKLAGALRINRFIRDDVFPQ
jgi:hypothetical protein